MPGSLFHHHSQKKPLGFWLFFYICHLWKCHEFEKRCFPFSLCLQDKTSEITQPIILVIRVWRAYSVPDLCTWENGAGALFHNQFIHTKWDQIVMPKPDNEEGPFVAQRFFQTLVLKKSHSLALKQSLLPSLRHQCLSEAHLLYTHTSSQKKLYPEIMSLWDGHSAFMPSLNIWRERNKQPNRMCHKWKERNQKVTWDFDDRWCV